MKKSILCLLTVASLSLLSTGTQAQWVRGNIPASIDCYSLAVLGTYTFAGCRSRSTANLTGVYVSTDNGATWRLPTHQLSTTEAYCGAFAFIGPNLFVGRYLGGVLLSTDNGNNWTSVSEGLEKLNVGCLAVSGTNLFAGTFTPAGVFLSTNNGANWNEVSSGLEGDINALAVSGTRIFAGTDGSGVYMWTNNGTSWTAVDSGLTNKRVWCLAVSGSYLLAGTNGGGVFRSTNNGTSWTAVNLGLTSLVVWSLLATGTNVFAGTGGYGVSLSTDNGANWTDTGGGLPPSNVYALAISGPYLLAGMGNNGVWRRPLSELIVDVREPETNLPNQYSLEQNYPNPFNPATAIQFSLPRSSFVTLKVFNLVGEEVATLISENLRAGKYSTEWNAGHVASGVYFYRLVAGSFVETKKLLLLK